ncbi:hypothetical protein [uncultured Xanthomonas sp.]|uniref:hypothetical protein n=1 Tax=uncultured Xanthomonas sp. TaxID=152831 RepID=UPI0025CEA309|nr:hypothetical protein [uncultured Xanthomonas sp.]
MNNEEKTPIDDEEFDAQSIVREYWGVLIVKIDVYDKTGVKLAKQPGGRFRIISKNGVNPSVYRTFNSASEACFF